MKYLSANVRGMRNKQEGLKALAQFQGCHIVGISETWWEESCDWDAVMDSYRVFGRYRQVRQRGSVACKGGIGPYSACSRG